VVEVEFVRCTAYRTLSAIAFPDFKFHCRGDKSPALGIHMDWLREVFLAFDSD
jgi:hypothetical protein